MTITGRQGLSASNCRTPVGFFYGHSHLLPNDLVPSSSALDLEDIRENTATLAVLADHCQCHYKLAVERLRSLLRPLLNASVHVDHYLQSQQTSFVLLTAGGPSTASTPTNDEDLKVTQAYDECLKLQRQLNLVWAALRRLSRCVDEQSDTDGDEPEKPRGDLVSLSSHQLNSMAHSLVNVLLAATAAKKQIKIERRTAEQLFNYLYVTSSPAAQLSTAALLSQSDDIYRWMPNFLADQLRKTLSSDASTALIPKDRVFVTLLFMGFKSIQLSSGIHLLDPILALLDDQLSSLNGQTDSPLAMAHLDLPFVNWLLLFCCCCLDRTANAGATGVKRRAADDDHRWDFLQAESVLLGRDASASNEAKNAAAAAAAMSVGGSAASRIYRRKLQKKLMQSQSMSHHSTAHHLQQYSLSSSPAAASTSTSAPSSSSWPSGGVLSGSNKAKFILAHSKHQQAAHKLSSALSAQQQKWRERAAALIDLEEMEAASASTGPTEESSSGSNSATNRQQPICSSSAAARVSKSLVSLLLAVGAASGSHQETFLLTCKVLARLSTSGSQNGLRLGHMVEDERQLATLLRLGASDSSATSSQSVWFSHSIYCLLKDVLRAGSITAVNTNSSSASTSSRKTKGDAQQSQDSTGKHAKLKVVRLSEKLPPMTVPVELTAYESVMDELPDNFLQLFQSSPDPSGGGDDSVPPVLKKAWPSISSVMKNLAECNKSSNLSASGYGMDGSDSAGGGASNCSSGVGDLRDELRLDGPWKLKSDLLHDAFYEAVLLGLTGSFHDNKRRPLPEAVPDDPIASSVVPSDQNLLSSAFNNIFTSPSLSSTRGAKDVLASLKLWVLLNSDGYSSSSSNNSQSSSACLTTDTSPAIVLSPEAINSVLQSLAKMPGMEIGDWTAVLRSLTWLSSPRWLLTDQQLTEEGLGELADQMCAGTVIRSVHLTKILFNFISGHGLLPFAALGDKQLVGPSVVSALSDALSGLKVWCNTALVGSQLGTRLRDSLLQLFLQLGDSVLARGAGPLDAQICLIQCLLKLGVQGLETSLSMRVVDTIVRLTLNHLERRSGAGGSAGGLTCVDSGGGQPGDQQNDDRICFSGSFTSSPSTNSCNSLAASLGLDAALPSTGTATASRRSRTAAPTPAADSSSSNRIPSCTRSTLMSLCLQLAYRLVSSSESELADALLASTTMMDLLEAANCCLASPFASSLGLIVPSQHQLHSVADYALQLLWQLAERATNIRIVFDRLMDFVRSSRDLSEPLLIFLLQQLQSRRRLAVFHHQADGFRSICLALSRTPLQLLDTHSGRLVSNVLSYVSQTTSSQSTSSGIGRSTPRMNRLTRLAGASSAAAAAVASAAAAAAVAQHFDSAAPLAVFRRSGLRLDDDDDFGLLNVAPLSTISCSHPSAQPADVLLQPNAPHRRARSPSWSHHFYPQEQFIELSIVLPCPVLVTEIQLHPHLTSLATCPAAVGVEMSPEGPGQLYPVGSVQSATGLTTIALKLESAQVAALVLLRLYKPRDSSNIGLAQIRILASLALPSDQQQQHLFGSMVPPAPQPGLTWLCIVHHCLTLAEKPENNEEEEEDDSVNEDEKVQLLASLRQTAGSQDRMVEQCCALLNTGRHSSAPRAGLSADVVQMASDILIHLGRHSTDLAQRFVRIQLQQEQQLSFPTSVLSCTPAVSNVIYELCTAPNAASLLVQWLHRAAKQQQVVSASMVHCTATVLWLNCPSFDDFKLIRSLFEWTKSIGHLADLKAAVDYALCSLCRHVPSAYGSLLQIADSNLLDRPLVLQTLARAAQSLPALDQLVLHPTGLLNLVSRTIGEFSLSVLEGRLDSAQQLTNRMVSALDFWTALCDEWSCSGAGRDVLASYLDREEPLLLQLLLQALCTYCPSTGHSDRHDRIEDSTITFLRQFCWTHADNSKHLANILLGVLQPSSSSSRPLMTGFTRRLILQLLLEPEKLYLHVRVTAPGAVAAAQQVVHHPAYGHGKKHQLLYISAETTCAELIRLINGGLY